MARPDHEGLSIFVAGFGVDFFPDDVSIFEVNLIIFIKHQLETILKQMSLIPFASHSGSHFQIRILIDFIRSGHLNNLAPEGGQWL